MTRPSWLYLVHVADVALYLQVSLKSPQRHFHQSVDLQMREIVLGKFYVLVFQLLY